MVAGCVRPAPAHDANIDTNANNGHHGHHGLAGESTVHAMPFLVHEQVQFDNALDATQSGPGNTHTHTRARAVSPSPFPSLSKKRHMCALLLLFVLSVSVSVLPSML